MSENDKMFVFMRQLFLHVLFIWCNLYQIRYSECFQCDMEFKVICRQPCPSYCRQCQSEDLCLTCMLPNSKYTDTSSFICASMCKDQCPLNKTCLKECSIIRDMHQFRPILCITDELCFQCLNISANCLQCNTGKYGSHCENRCGHCKMDFNGVVNCNTITGECKGACDYGYFGQRCDRECKNCLSGSHSNKCDKITGKCSNGCLPGWFSYTCNETCSTNCLYGTCNQVNGQCVDGCKVGWYGLKCDYICSETCFKRSCDQFKGHCLHGCNTGWFGEACENACSNKCLRRTCQLSGNCSNGCLPGWFGEECKHTCSEKCLHRSCHMSGNCIHGCLPGWSGDKCDISCSDACFNKSCDQTSGVCEFGCIYGFFGLKCDERDYISTTNTPRLTDYNQLVNNSDSVRIPFAVVWTVAGVLITGLCCFIIMFIRKAIRRFKKYDYLNNSSRGNASQIYDEIAQNYSGDAESSVSPEAITIADINNTDTATVNCHSDYEEIALQSEVCIDEENERVYYLHPVS